MRLGSGMSVEHDAACLYERAQQALSGKWTLIIVRTLLKRGPLRFNELQRALGDVTPGPLTKHLKALEANGLVERRSFDEVPPRVEYSLTEVGGRLGPLVEEFERWSLQYARATYERASSPDSPHAPTSCAQVPAGQASAPASEGSLARQSWQ